MSDFPEQDPLKNVLCTNFEECRGYNIQLKGWKWLDSERNKQFLKKVFEFGKQGRCPKCNPNIPRKRVA